MSTAAWDRSRVEQNTEKRLNVEGVDLAVAIHVAGVASTDRQQRQVIVVDLRCVVGPERHRGNIQCAAAGQAVQSMNVMCDFPETTGLL